MKLARQGLTSQPTVPKVTPPHRRSATQTQFHMSPATKHTTTTLESLAAEVRPVVERDLGRRLDASVLRARRQSADAEAVVDALRSLALRGGKRIRAVLVCAGSAAFGSDWHAVVPAASGVEILHAYLLAHDDWMDGDETRRGGPSVHVM